MKSVICASCGARIRADRQWCLRCGETLRTAPATSPDPSSGLLSKGSYLMIGAVGSLTVLIGVAMWFQSSSMHRDDVAQPAPGAVPRSARRLANDAKGTASTSSTSNGLPAPVAALESTRAAAAGEPTSDFDNAKIRYQQVLLKKPNDPEALNGLGSALAHLGRIDDAIACFARAIDQAPDVWAYHFNLAHAEGQRERWDRAAAEYRIAARLMPRDYATQYNLGVALQKGGSDQAAIPELERAIQLAPDAPTFHLSLAMSLERTGKVADAEREYRQYVKMVPSAPDVERLRAHIQTLRNGFPSEPPRTSASS